MRSKTITQYSAYSGGSWKPRIRSHAQEVGTEIWAPTGVNSEFSQLKEVLLCKPDSSFKKVEHPERVQFLEVVNWRLLAKELKALEEVLGRYKIKIHQINPQAFKSPPPNLIFVRDLFFATPWGAILGRTASRVRAGEEKWAQEALARAGVPLLRAITGDGTFEGADALWLTQDTVLVGIGNRTNEEGLRQLKSVLSEYSVKVLAVELPQKVQHLLGMLQLVGKNTALLRTEISSRRLQKILNRFEYQTISVPESKEVTRFQAMNVVTLREREVIMPKNCPLLASLLIRNGIKIVAQLEVTQLARAAGGFACATGIVSRRLS